MKNSQSKLQLNDLQDADKRSLQSPLSKAIVLTLWASWSIQGVAAPNPNQQAIGAALSRCTNTDVAVCQASAVDLQSLTPDQVFGLGSMSTRINGGQATMPYDYFGANRKGKGKAGGGAGDIDLSAWNFWGKVDSGFGSQTATARNVSGFKFDNHNFMVGADYRINEQWMAGANFDYRHSNATFNAGRGDTLSDSYIGGLYSSYFITDALHVDATATYGGLDYETRRNIEFFGNSSVAKATPTAEQYSFSWGGGYDFNYQALTVAPYLRGEYIGLGIDRYSEHGSAAAVQFNKQNVESLISTLGVQSSYAFSFPWGVLIPQLRGEWHHQYLDGSRSVTGSFVAAGSSSRFTMVSDGPSRDYYTFGAEVSSVLPGGISAFLAYETLQGYQNINSNRLMLGGRVEF